MSDNFCTQCGILATALAKFCGACGNSLTNQSVVIGSISFLAQMDCSDFGLNNLYNLVWEKLVDDVFLASTPIGSRVSRVDDEDAEYSAEGDISLSEFEDFAALMKNTVRYSTLNITFDGLVDNEAHIQWTKLRTTLISLRRQTFEATGPWSAFEYAPVSISLAYLNIDGQSKPLDVSARSQMLRYLDELESKAATNLEIKRFLTFFEFEVTNLRQDRASRFLEKWFATELLLTQKTLQFSDSESSYFLVPVLNPEQFSWDADNAFVPTLLEIDRNFDPANLYTINPIPKNNYREGSDWYWPLEDAKTESFRRGASGLAFNKVGFVANLWMLNFLAEEGALDDVDFAVEDFLNRHAANLEPLIEHIDDSNLPSLEEGLPMNDETKNLIASLPLPDNAEDIWDEYLNMLGLKD